MDSYIQATSCGRHSQSWTKLKNLIILCFLLICTNNCCGQNTTTDSITEPISSTQQPIASSSVSSSNPTAASLPSSTTQQPTTSSSVSSSNPTAASLPSSTPPQSSSLDRNRCKKKRGKITVSHEGCNDKEILVPMCGGFCRSETLVKAEAPYMKSNCRCCTSRRHEIGFKRVTFTCQDRQLETHKVWIAKDIECACQLCTRVIGNNK